MAWMPHMRSPLSRLYRLSGALLLSLGRKPGFQEMWGPQQGGKAAVAVDWEFTKASDISMLRMSRGAR